MSAKRLKTGVAPFLRNAFGITPKGGTAYEVCSIHSLNERY